MQGIVLCGGYGLRMGHLTQTTPKPLLKLGEHTLLDYILKNISRSKVSKVYLAVDYLREKIVDHVREVENEYDFDIDFLYGKSGEDTAGAILGAKDFLKDDFFVTVGDDLTNLDFSDFYKMHKESKAIASIAAIRENKKYDFGVLDVKGDYVTGFEEKPVTAFTTNIGSYFFKPQIFDHIEFGDDFAQDVFPRLLRKNLKIYCYTGNFFWYSIGTIKKYDYYKDNLHLIEKYF